MESTDQCVLRIVVRVWPVHDPIVPVWLLLGMVPAADTFGGMLEAAPLGNEPPRL